jgi:RNA polymerase sigma-70 factor (ECF subfamily)
MRAFERLVSPRVDRLYAVAYRVVRDFYLAQDAVQDALEAAWRDLPKLREAAAFDGWLIQVLLHACYRESRRTQRSLSVVRIGEPVVDDASALVADRDQIDQAFRRLTPEHRAVLVVTHYLGLSGPEAAAALGLPPGTLKSRLHHAIRQLRAAIEADERTVAHREGPSR